MRRALRLVTPLLLLVACAEWRAVEFYARAVFDGEHSTSVEDAPPIVPASCPSFASDSAVVRLFVIGDWGSGSALQRAVAHAMASLARSQRPHAVISTGDNFYPSGVSSVGDVLFRQRWEEIYADSALQVPWIVALGNHDHRGSIAAQIAYSTLNQWWYMPAPYYTISLTAGSTTVAVFVMDTDSLLTDRHNRFRQLRWLDSALGRVSATVKIVVGHHPLRSYGIYGDTRLLVRMLKPILDRHDVALYLCGHDHDLQLILHPEDRFACVVSGGGGKARRTRYGAFTRFAWTGGGFAYLACRPDRSVVVTFIGRTGRLLWCDTIQPPHASHIRMNEHRQ
ncbi:MAG: acid phosphatase [Candidatus Kapaibacterium sp.]|nr:MAG: acid phosphatase [Candidatus Kapabacteria bacterium]